MQNVQALWLTRLTKDYMLLYNAIKTPDGTLLESTHRWDYNAHTDANGHAYAVDGGLDYIRRLGPPDYEELSLTINDDHSKIRECFRWGTRGPNGDQSVLRVKLKDLTTEHIFNILKTQSQISSTVRLAFINELHYRNENNAKV